MPMNRTAIHCQYQWWGTVFPLEPMVPASESYTDERGQAMSTATTKP